MVYLLDYFVVVDHQQEIKNLLGYKMNPEHRIIEHINFMYNWLFKLYIHGVHEFYIEQHIEIVLDSLSEEWNQIRQSLKDRLSALDFNSLVEDMLLERERLYTIMGIRCIGWSARKLDSTAKFILWFDNYELGGLNDDEEVDDIIGDLDYVPTM